MMSHKFFPGKQAWYASDSPTTQFSAVFEDDGDTGYLYGYDRTNEAGILDAMQIYNVSSLAGGDRESVAEIIWTPDGLKAALLINDFAHAIVNFADRSSYCRTGFPSAPHDWNRGAWAETLMDIFRRR